MKDVIVHMGTEEEREGGWEEGRKGGRARGFISNTTEGGGEPETGGWSVS